MNRRNRPLIAWDAKRSDDALVAGDFKETVKLVEVAVPQPLGSQDVPIEEYLEAGHDAERSTLFDIGIRKLPNQLF